MKQDIVRILQIIDIQKFETEIYKYKELCEKDKQRINIIVEKISNNDSWNCLASDLIHEKIFCTYGSFTPILKKLDFYITLIPKIKEYNQISDKINELENQRLNIYTNLKGYTENEIEKIEGDELKLIRNKKNDCYKEQDEIVNDIVFMWEEYHE